MDRFFILIGALIILVCTVWVPPALADQQLISVYTDITPSLDGVAKEAVWSLAEPVTVKDGTSDIEITLRSLYTPTSIFFLATFPDSDESRDHRPWVWNDISGLYEVGPEREDCLVFKWFMGDLPQDIHIDSDEPHIADTWFWKAARTDPVGYADDKIQRLARNKLSKSIKLKSQTGKTIYLQRKGDQGEAAYFDQIFVEYNGQILQRFQQQTPGSSRADIQAKGRWEKGLWTVEISRRLETGHGDDIQFDTDLVYLFGVSRYEIAGRKADPTTTQPLYGAGRLSEPLHLRFTP